MSLVYRCCTAKAQSPYAGRYAERQAPAYYAPLAYPSVVQAQLVPAISPLFAYRHQQAPPPMFVLTPAVSKEQLRMLRSEIGDLQWPDPPAPPSGTRMSREEEEIAELERNVRDHEEQVQIQLAQLRNSRRQARGLAIRAQAVRNRAALLEEQLQDSVRRIDEGRATK